ncbi:MAG: N-acetyltransferase family protein [Myxococcaceae bacterium]|jgi:phosphinothricin acetyltransferase|nr:MAG: N-acetyltransferase family protein [Myxococcaceae bacterium]
MIRDATEADLPAILAIYNDVLANSTAIFSETPTTLEDRRQWFRARRDAGYPVLVATDDSGVLGFATFGDFRTWPGYRHTVEHTVHVRADARGRGVGRGLVTVLLERAGGLGKHVMVAGVDADNLTSIRLHERLGFQRAGTLHQVGCKFGRWLDLTFLERRLDERLEPGPARLTS